MSDVNLYEAPEADTTAVDELPLKHPRSCEIGFGWKWLLDGYRLMSGNMWLAGAMVLVMFIINFFAAFIPFASIFVSMPLAAGMLFAAHRSYTEHDFEFGDLFEAFRNNYLQILVATLLGMVAMMVVMFALMIVGGIFIAIFSLFGDVATFLAVAVVIALAAVVCIAIGTLMWFTPVLVMLHQLEPIEAIKLSYRASIKNMLPMAWWGLLVTLLMVLSIVTAGLALFFILPAMYFSFYAAYRDIFIDFE